MQRKPKPASTGLHRDPIPIVFNELAILVHFIPHQSSPSSHPLLITPGAPGTPALKNSPRLYWKNVQVGLYQREHKSRGYLRDFKIFSSFRFRCKGVVVWCLYRSVALDVSVPATVRPSFLAHVHGWFSSGPTLTRRLMVAYEIIRGECLRRQQ